MRDLTKRIVSIFLGIGLVFAGLVLIGAGGGDPQAYLSGAFIVAVGVVFITAALWWFPTPPKTVKEEEEIRKATGVYFLITGGQDLLDLSDSPEEILAGSSCVQKVSRMRIGPDEYLVLVVSGSAKYLIEALGQLGEEVNHEK